MIDRRILSLGVPALGALAVEPLYVAVDTAIIGRVGTAELAGLAAAATVLSIVAAGSNFLAYGTTERVARARGAGQHNLARSTATQALWVAVAIALVVTPIIVAAAPSIIAIVGAHGTAATHGVRYLRIAAVGLPAVLLAIAAQGILRGVGDYRRPLWVLGAGNLLNLVIEIPLVFGLGLSVTGSALSTVISQYVVAVAFVPALLSHLAPKGARRPERRPMASLLAVGKNLVLRVASMMVILTGAAMLCARSGEVELAAHQVVAGAFMLTALVLDALAVPAHTLIGETMGADDNELARRIASRVYVLSGIGGFILAAGTLALAPVLASLFTTDEAVSTSVAAGLTVLALLLVPGSIAFAGDGILIGAGDHRFLGLASLVQTLVMLPIILLPSVSAGPGVGATWGILSIWMVMRAFTVLGRSRRLLWPRNDG